MTAPTIPDTTPYISQNIIIQNRIGESFPLQWMLRKRLEEELSQNWPPRSRYPDGDDDNDEMNRSGGGGGEIGDQAGGAGAAGGAVVEDRHNSEVARFAIEAICECTGVSTELAAYALRFSHVRDCVYDMFGSRLCTHNAIYPLAGCCVVGVSISMSRLPMVSFH